MAGRRPKNPVKQVVLLLLGALALAGCTGSINGGATADRDGVAATGGSGSNGQAGTGGQAGLGGAGGASSSSGEGGAGAAGEGAGGASGSASCTEPVEVGAPVPVRRLTAPQLTATVADVLGREVAFPISDETLIGYRANTTTSFDATSARVMLTTSEQIAITIAPELTSDARCAADCESFLLDELGPQLFRRPLDADTRTRFAALYEQGVATEGQAGGVRWLITGMLQSPRFLYLLEATDDSGKLDAYSIASRLSYALWAGPPDAELLAAAADGELDDAPGIAAAAERMIDDPKLLRGLSDFAGQWLSLEHLDNTAARPDVAALDAETREALKREPVELLAAHIRSDATVADLLLATEITHEPALAEIYGDDVLSTEDGVSQLDPDKRAGLLALPGVLAALSHAEQTSPTLRGRAVLANLLCRPPAPPPANVVPSLPPSVPGASTRERLEAHFSDPTCASCHASMDGIGFAFERFDWLGRSRELDNDRPIDTSASFEIAGDPISVDGAADMARALADRRDVAECVARHFSRFAVGVRETRDFGCTVEALAEAAQGARGLRGMLLAFVTTPWFIEPAPPLEEM